MKRRAAISILLSAIGVTGLAQTDLPDQQTDEPLDIEPPLLIQNRDDEPLPPNAKISAPADANLEQLQKDLERAQRSADGAPHLYRIGVIAKADVEQRALKIVRLRSKIENARFQNAVDEFSGVAARFIGGEISILEFASAQSKLEQALQSCDGAAATLKKAELEAALINLQRQQRLLAVGIGRKSDVSRAQEKVAALQSEN